MPISKYHFIKEDTEIVVSRYKQIEIDVLCVSVHSFFLTQSNTHFSFDVCLLLCVHVLWAGVFLHQTLYLKPPESNFYQYFFLSVTLKPTVIIEGSQVCFPKYIQFKITVLLNNLMQLKLSDQLLAFFTLLLFCR